MLVCAAGVVWQRIQRGRHQSQIGALPPAITMIQTGRKVLKFATSGKSTLAAKRLDGALVVDPPPASWIDLCRGIA